MAMIARFPPALTLILSYFSRMAPSFVMSCQEACTRVARREFLPILVILPIRMWSALEYCDGVSPT